MALRKFSVSLFSGFTLTILEVQTGKHNQLPKQHYEKIDAKTDMMKACTKSLVGKSRAVYRNRLKPPTQVSGKCGKSL